MNPSGRTSVVAEVGALRSNDAESEPGESTLESIAFGGEVGAEVVVVVIRQCEARRDRVLERATRDVREVLAHHAHCADQIAGPVAQPTFHPVNENVLPPEPIVTVRSAIPGSVAIGTCGWPSNHRCS